MHNVRVDLRQPKFGLPWEGPFVIHKNVENGCYDLKMIDGGNVFPVNAKFLKLRRYPIARGHFFP